MKYMYLDESVSQDGNYVGYGALFLSDDTLGKQIIEKALTELIMIQIESRNNAKLWTIEQ